MTKNYNEIKKEIEKLEALKKNAVVYTETTKEIVATEGHGIFVNTGRYEVVGEWKTDKNKVAEIEKEIAELKNLDTYKDGKTKEEAKEIERAKRAKAKRYRKELAELENRKAYLEKWLAENE